MYGMWLVAVWLLGSWLWALFSAFSLFDSVLLLLLSLMPHTTAHKGTQQRTLLLTLALTHENENSSFSISNFPF